MNYIYYVKAIIGLTSWKKRIKIVSKTIFNIHKMCPDFHIVLTLSEDEFPKKENELPDDLKLMLNNNIFELIWCKKNYFSFKKIIFAALKYPNLPIITADDDCYYNCNYADILYQKFLNSPNTIITSKGGGPLKGLYWGRGPNTLFPPNFFNFNIVKILDYIISKPRFSRNEDILLGIIAKRKNIKILDLKCKRFYTFHDEIEPQSLTNAYSLSKDITFFKSILKELGMFS